MESGIIMGIPNQKPFHHNYEILQYGYYSDSDKTTMKKLFQWK